MLGANLGCISHGDVSVMGLIFGEKRTCVHVQRTLKMSRGLYTGGNFKQNTSKKSEGKLGTLFAILI